MMGADLHCRQTVDTNSLYSRHQDVARRTAEGLSKRDIIRRLKRYLAREVYQAVLTDHRARQSSTKQHPTEVLTYRGVSDDRRAPIAAPPWRPTPGN